MSSNGKITQEDVWKACDTVFSEGKPVTNERVRAVLGRGSYSTISEHVKSWKERPDAEVSAKDYPMSDWVKKTYEEINQVHWNTFVGRYELTVDNERIAELEKEIETLRDKLTIKERDSIQLELVDKIRQEQDERIEKYVQRIEQQGIEIKKLKDFIQTCTGNVL
ncbi:DNA-binding protein [Nostoc sp. CHAB 5844]|nr:DNA-binding protein [Nostoc sp. CHAB 5844]